MRYVIELWMAWAGSKNAQKFSKFGFLQCFSPKVLEKVVVNRIFQVLDDSTIVWDSLSPKGSDL